MHAMQVSPRVAQPAGIVRKVYPLKLDHGLSSWLFLDTLPNLPRAPLYERGIVPDTHTHIHTQRDTHTHVSISISIYIYIYTMYIYIYVYYTFKKDPEYVHKLKYIYINTCLYICIHILICIRTCICILCAYFPT